MPQRANGTGKKVKGKGTAFAVSIALAAAAVPAAGSASHLPEACASVVTRTGIRVSRARGSLGLRICSLGEIASPMAENPGRPERAAITQPGVEARALPGFYPGFASHGEPTLKGLNRFSLANDATPSGLVLLFMETQDRRWRANPGLSEHNPIEVVKGHRERTPSGTFFAFFASLRETFPSKETPLCP
jgi:hypothetical protein